MHTWLPWEVHTSPHDLPGYTEPIFPVTETELGNLGAAICYDWLFPEAIRQLALGGAEVLIRVSAYMDPWGTANPMDWWTLVNRVRALENMSYVVAANQAASLPNYPPFSWPGGSMLVDYDGRLLAQANPGAGSQIVVGPIDIGALRQERDRRRGHQLLAHLRTETYTQYGHSLYPPHGAHSGPPDVDRNNRLTAEACASCVTHSGTTLRVVTLGATGATGSASSAGSARAEPSLRLASRALRCVSNLQPNRTSFARTRLGESESRATMRRY